MALLALLTGCPTETVDKPLRDWTLYRTGRGKGTREMVVRPRSGPLTDDRRDVRWIPVRR